MFENDFAVALRLKKLFKLGVVRVTIVGNDYDYVYLVNRTNGMEIIFLDLSKKSRYKWRSSYIPIFHYRKFNDLSPLQLAIVCLLGVTDNMSLHVKGYGHVKNKKQVLDQDIKTFSDLKRLEKVYGQALVSEMTQKLLQFGWQDPKFHLDNSHELKGLSLEHFVE